MVRDSNALDADSTRVFAALGDPARLRLVSRLCDNGPMSITELASGAAITRQAVTKHLRVLESARIIKGSRQGRERIWELEHQSLEIARKFLAHISSRWDSALGRLNSLVEEPD